MAARLAILLALGWLVGVATFCANAARGRVIDYCYWGMEIPKEPYVCRTSDYAYPYWVNPSRPTGPG